MTNGNESIYGVDNCGGLSKREYFASTAKVPNDLQFKSIHDACSFLGIKPPTNMTFLEQLKISVMVEAKYKQMAADALIKALNNEQ